MKEIKEKLTYILDIKWCIPFIYSFIFNLLAFLVILLFEYDYLDENRESLLDSLLIFLFIGDLLLLLLLISCFIYQIIKKKWWRAFFVTLYSLIHGSFSLVNFIGLAAISFISTCNNFDAPPNVDTESVPTDQLKTLLEEYDNLDYQKLEYNSDFKNLWHRDDYPDDNTPGTVKCNEVFDIPTFFKSDNFEYIDFTSTGFTSITGQYQMTESIRNGYDEQGNKSEFPLIEKLKFEFNKIENYNVNELSIDVYNITDDFNQFTKNYYALKNLPILEKSVSGSDSLDLNNNLVFSLSTPTIDWTYPYNLLGKTGADTVNKFSSMLEDDFKYSGPNYSNVVDFLEIDIEAGKARKEYTEDNVFEIVINFDEKLHSKTKNLNLDESTLIKLDVVVEKETLQSDILSTLNKEKKILYTYYLKFPQLNEVILLPK